MQYMAGTLEDNIRFDLKQIALLKRSKVELTQTEKDELRHLSKKEREKREEEILKEKESKKYEFLRQWAKEIKDWVEQSDLPPELKQAAFEVIDAVVAIKDPVAAARIVERKVASFEEKWKAEVERKEERRVRETAAAMATATVGMALVPGIVATGAVIAGQQMAPFIQVNNKEAEERAEERRKEIEAKTAEMTERKIIPELARGDVPAREIAREYPRKAGSMYPKAFGAIEEKYDQALLDEIVKKTQDAQKKAGLTVQTAEEIAENFKKLPPVKQRWAKEAALKENPELAAQKAAEEKAATDKAMAKSLRRYKERHEPKPQTMTKAERRAERRKVDALAERLVAGRAKPDATPEEAAKEKADAVKSVRRTLRKQAEKEAKKARAEAKQKRIEAAKEAKKAKTIALSPKAAGQLKAIKGVEKEDKVAGFSERLAKSTGMTKEEAQKSVERTLRKAARKEKRNKPKTMVEKREREVLVDQMLTGKKVVVRKKKQERIGEQSKITLRGPIGKDFSRVA